jgi:3-methyladenine DNA glycosylase Mpg
VAIYHAVDNLPRCSVSRRLSKAFFRRSVHEVAPDLIGATLLFNGIGGRLVEVEAKGLGKRGLDPGAGAD